MTEKQLLQKIRDKKKLLKWAAGLDGSDPILKSFHRLELNQFKIMLQIKRLKESQK